MKLGYLAINQYGESIKLTEPTHPRKQLLSALLLSTGGVAHCEKMYCETTDGQTKHVGYVIGADGGQFMRFTTGQRGAQNNAHSN